jgi:hypothetical protein
MRCKEWGTGKQLCAAAAPRTALSLLRPRLLLQLAAAQQFPLLLELLLLGQSRGRGGRLGGCRAAAGRGHCDLLLSRRRSGVCRGLLAGCRSLLRALLYAALILPLLRQACGLGLGAALLRAWGRVAAR